MSTLTILNLDDDIELLLRRRATQHGKSVEDEMHSILRQSLSEPEYALPLGQRLAHRFKDVAVDLTIPPRSMPRSLQVMDDAQ